MKRLLLSTSALVALGAAGAASPALAQQRMQIGVSGFAKQEFGYAWNKNFDSTAAAPTKRSGFDQQSDVEIHFRGQLKLDNGITVAVLVELEGETSADTIDEQFLRVFGSFGDIRLGAFNNAAYLMHYQAPEYGVGVSEAFIQNYIAYPGGGFGAGATSAQTGVFMQTTRISVDNDANKIGYFTPRLYGFQAGATYTPEHSQKDDSFRAVPRYNNGYSVAINYDNKFGAFSLAGDVGYYHADAPPNTLGMQDMEAWSTGLNVGYAGFLVGGSFRRYTKGSVNSAGGGIGSTPAAAFTAAGAGIQARGNAWNIGAAYSAGPMGVSLTYQDAAMDGNQIAGQGGQLKANWLLLSGRYDIGPGVQLYGTLARAKYTDDIDATSVGNNEGHAAVTGIRITF